MILEEVSNNEKHSWIKSAEQIVEAMEITQQFGELAGFNERDILFLQLVTEEACTNAYEYVSSNGIEGFKVSWYVKDGALQIVVTEEGEPYSIEIDESKENFGMRGRGIQLIVNLMDEVRLESEGQYVSLIMMKRIGNQ